MPTAQRSIWVDIIMYIIYLLIIAISVSFLIGLTKHISCCTGPKNAYEHFQDANAVNNHINQSLIEMNTKFDMYLQQLDDSMNNTQNMKAQTCSIYKGVHDKYIKSKAAEVADQAEYQLPQNQQRELQKTRAKNAENSWLNNINLYLYRHNEKGMIDCSQVSAPPTDEGFQDATQIAPATLDNLAQNLQGKIKVFSATMESPTFKSWLTDCNNIEGTAHFLNMYIHNVLINAELEKCKADYTKNINGFKDESEEDQNKDNDKANLHCTTIYGPQLESFQNQQYVNTAYSFPVPYPSAGLTDAQQGYYSILSAAQDKLNEFSKLVGNTYQNMVASYKKMNDTNTTYINYNKQINSVQDSNYTQQQANTLKN